MDFQFRSVAIEVENATNNCIFCVADCSCYRTFRYFHLPALDSGFHWVKNIFRSADFPAPDLPCTRDKSGSLFASRKMVDQSCGVVLSNDVYIIFWLNKSTVFPSR